MAQLFQSEFGTIYIPGSNFDVQVKANVTGLATTGVIALVGEAEGGKPGSSDPIIDNFFGPDELGAVQSKYLSGNIVDAFRALVAPANDVDIQGAVQRIYIYKTNASTKASSAIANAGLGSYGSISDKNYGQKGNLINYRVAAAQAEVEPSTEPMSYIPSPSAATLIARVNGGAASSLAISALTSPAALASQFEGVAGMLAQGGVDRDILSGLSGTNIVITVSGDELTATLASGSVFAATPVAGDTLLIGALGEYSAVADSVYSGAGDENQGAYVVKSVSNTTTSAFITAQKLRNNDLVAFENPVAVGAAAISVNEDDVFIFSPIEASDATGDDRNILTGLVGTAIVTTVVSSDITFTLAAASVWDSEPQIGDLITIPTGSAYAGAGSANVGHYQISAVANTATSAFITATRLSNGAPVGVASTPIAAVSDIQDLRPYKSGLGKAIEISDGGGTDNISLLLRQLGLAASVSFISTVASPQLLTSSAEQIQQLNTNRQLDNVQEQLQSGGDIALRIGYLGTTCPLTITATALTTAPVGGSGSALSLLLADFSTIADLAAYLDSQTAYSASVGTATVGQRPALELDIGVYSICSSVSESSEPGRIKRDLADWEAEAGESILIDFAAVTGAAGLPDVTSSQVFLSGGAKGGSTGAEMINALTALEGVAVNFVVPLFSRDASLDIADGLTESGSTYTIDAVHQAVKDHVIALSTFKRRKHRQGFLSFRGTFLEGKTKANNAASFRLSMNFQDPNNLSSDGTINQFQPWYSAAVAAGMQAAGFNKAIVKKVLNVSGIQQAAGDYSDTTPSQVEDALRNGLLPAERVPNFGIRWVSDQTTYAADANFVFNSIQAVYAADTIGLSLTERLERAFVGKSLADVSAAAVGGFIQAVMSEFLRLKLTAPSGDAVLGFKNLVVKITGPVIQVSLEIKLATAVYFIPVSFTISQVEQTATF